ncbi:MAG: sugar ABC transporter [Burkholderiaceae bacterium]|nr:sugar ABC transporter [Burkholderiaceae bacterium]
MMWYQRPDKKSELGSACLVCPSLAHSQNPIHLLWVLRLFAVAMLALISWQGNGQARAAMTSASPTASPNVAFYYRGDLPVDELQAFDAVVIDPAVAALPQTDLAPHTAWFARVDLQGLTSKSEDINTFISQKISPLWEKGYQGFLLDDGTAVSEKVTPFDERLDQAIKAIHSQYPQAQLMLRNHLAVAQANAQNLYAVVVDSLYQQSRGYGSFLAVVPDAVRTSTLQQIKQIQTQTALPVVAIDYCTVGNQACRREVAAKLVADGVTPFVTTPGLGAVGVGRIEVMPRKILLVQTLDRDQPLDETMGARSIAMPLNYLGYDIQYADINQALPSGISNDRYAGIVVAIDRTVNNSRAWRQWVLGQISQGMRVAFFNQFGFPLDTQVARALNLEVVTGKPPLNSPLQIVSKDPMMGFEIMPAPDIREAQAVRADSNGQPLLRLKAGDYLYDAAALTPWGGYVLAGNTVLYLDAIEQNRWAIHPIKFLRKALALPDMPVPDLTSENGRRLMFTHVDGDGFASRGEFSGATQQYSGQILYNEVFTKYQIPMLVSVIEGEIGPGGLHSELAPRLEPIARKIFSLPNVEIGSHTYSHPFYLSQINEITGEKIGDQFNPEWAGTGAFSLDIPNYKFNINREIQGSIDYITQRLAPTGKSVLAVLWSGDAAAPKIALRHVGKVGALNINGGNTTITKARNSWTNISPYGVAKGNRPDEYQVYAGVMNENVYTNDWMGPFYGFQSVLETFALTDTPIRFKPVNIYYHFYSGTKAASLKALHAVFNAALKQPVFPIYTTEYINRALDWRHVAVARDGNRWMVRSGANLRQLRWPGAGIPDLSTASGVSGYLPGPGGLYIHMGGNQASFIMTPQTVGVTPYIAQASGFVRNFQRTGTGMEFELGGYYKPFVQLADAMNCRASINGKSAGTVGKTGAMTLNVSGQATQSVSYHSIKVNCE